MRSDETVENVTGEALDGGNDEDRVSVRVAWFSVAILMLVAVLSYMDRLIISLMVEPIRASLGISDFQIGLVQGIGFGVFFALFGLPMGWLVDRYSRRTIIYWGMTVWSLAAASCGLAQNFWHLLVSRFGVGIGEASLSPAAYSIIADLFPPRRLALALGVFAAGSSLGAAIAYAAGGALIGYLEKFGEVSMPLVGVLEPWQMVFMITGLPGVAVALLVFLIPEPKRRNLIDVVKPAQADAAPEAVTQVPQESVIPFLKARWRFFTCHFLGFGIVAALAYGAVSWMPVLLLRRFDMDVAHVGLLLGGISAFAGIPGFIFSGWLVDKWYASGRRDAHVRYFVIVSLIGAGLAVICFQVANSPWTVLPVYFVIAFIQPFTGPAVAQLQLVTPNHLRGQVSAIFVMVFNLMGMCLGPPLVPFITDFILHDPMKVNTSLAIFYACGGLLAAGVFSLALAPGRAAIAEALGE